MDGWTVDAPRRSAVMLVFSLFCAHKLVIAEVTGKQHKNVMQAIRKMESAWEKICGLKFQLTSRTISQPNGGTRIVPCYSLTKTECLSQIYTDSQDLRNERAKLERTRMIFCPADLADLAELVFGFWFLVFRKSV